MGAKSNENLAACVPKPLLRSRPATRSIPMAPNCGLRSESSYLWITRLARRSV